MRALLVLLVWLAFAFVFFLIGNATSAFLCALAGVALSLWAFLRDRKKSGSDSSIVHLVSKVLRQLRFLS